MTKRTVVVTAILLGSIFSTAARSASDAEKGAAKAVVCSACHGANGNSANPEWPSLAGLGADYIAAQLSNFKEGRRQNPVMMPNAMALSAEDMAELGAYFGALKNTGLETDAAPASWEAGQKLFRAGNQARGIPACMACHGPAARGNEAAKFPALRGQHSVYTMKQLNDYASGARTTGPNNIMQSIAKKLTADEMRDVASYLQGIR